MAINKNLEDLLRNDADMDHNKQGRQPPETYYKRPRIGISGPFPSNEISD